MTSVRSCGFDARSSHESEITVYSVLGCTGHLTMSGAQPAEKEVLYQSGASPIRV